MSPGTALTASRSIYRGYSYEGLGEGPGRPIARGEQFLAADPPFVQDADALGALRPWMTLDLDAGDHRRLGDRLEAWSCFTYGDWTVVVRLTPAGTFDRRTAYFSHARAFGSSAIASGADPGALLGRSEAFASHWQDGAEPDRTAVPSPAMVRPEQVDAERETAAALLAHLLQGLLSRRPTVVAVPVEELAAGAPLHALVSFARAALPPTLKRRSRIRVYSRSPEVFLGRMESDLLVVPEAVASDALSVRRDAVLLDRRGQRHAGPEPDPQVQEWAHKVTLWTCDHPRALLDFATRYGERVWNGETGAPSNREVAAVAVAVRVSEELRTDREPSKNFLGQLKNAAGKIEPGAIPWDRLLGAEDWNRFPRRDVLELVFAGIDILPEGARDLQEAATQAAEKLGWSLGELLATGWKPADDSARRRLVDLSGRAPGLVPEEHLTHCLQGVPLRRLMGSGQLSHLLETENGIELLARWATELGDLPEILAEEGSRHHLLRAVLENRLTPSVLEAMLSTARARGQSTAWLGGWLSGMETGALLKLAGTLPGRDTVLKPAVVEVLLGRMERDPVEATARLIRSGAWSWWRRLAPERAPKRRTWALAWLGSPVWEEPSRVDPRLDDWELVMADLGECQTDRELAEIFGNGLRTWPRIPLFADRQIEDLARRMPDLGTLADFVERCDEDEILPRKDLEVRAFGAFAAGRPELRSLDATGLRWLGEAHDPATLPALSAAAADVLFKKSGPREARLVDNLATWLESVGPEQGSRGDLLPWLDKLGKKRRSPVSDGGRARAQELADRGYHGVAVLLDPELEERRARRHEVRQFLDTLTRGDCDASFWGVLQERLAAFRQGHLSERHHPLRALATELSGAANPERSVPESAWPRFAALMDRFPELFAATDDTGEAPLPAFELAIVLFDGLTVGALAVRLAFSAPRKLTESEFWWRSLLRGVDDCRRREGRRSTLDRPDLARALLGSARHDLSERERAACARALWLDTDSEGGPSGLFGLPRAHHGGS